MNAPFVVAQATGAAASAAPVQTIKLYKPNPGETVVFKASFTGTVKIIFTDIANEKITLVKDNSKQRLHVVFDDGSQAIIEPFYDSTGSVLANFIIEVGPNQDVTGAQFALQFPITTDQSVLPAAGPGAAGQASGANFSDPSVDPLGPSNPLPLLGQEELPNIQFTATQPANINEELPGGEAPLTPFVLAGAIGGVVEEEHLAEFEEPTDIGIGNEDENDLTDANDTDNPSGLDQDTSSNFDNTTNFFGPGSNGYQSLATLIVSSAGTPTFAFADLTGTPINDTAGNAVFSQGAPVEWLFMGATLVEGVADGRIVFFLTLDATTGDYTFFLNDQIDHPIISNDPGDGTSPTGALEETLSLNLAPVVIITDGNGDHTLEDNAFTVAVIDDTPITGENANVTLDDEAATVPYDAPNLGGIDDVAPDTANTTGTLAFNLGADVDGTVLLLDTGAPVGFTYTVTDGGLTLTISQSQTDANGVTANVDVIQITLTDDMSGDYTVEQLHPVFHSVPGTTEENQLFTINYQVTDFDQDTIDGNFIISVNDDTPQVCEGSVFGEVDEDGLASPLLSDGNLDASRPGETSGTNDNSTTIGGGAGSLAPLVDFGADGPNATAFGLVDATAADAFITSLGLKSQGDDVNDVSISGNTLTALASDGREVFKLTVNGDGSWEFELLDQVDHPLTDDPSTVSDTETAFEDTLTINLGGLLQAFDGDNDPVTLDGANFNITIRDDIPFLDNLTNVDGSIAEATSDDGLTGSFDTSIGADEPGQFDINPVGQDQYFFVQTDNPDGTITLQAFFDDAHTQPVYTLIVDPAGETYNFHLDADALPGTVTTFSDSDVVQIDPGAPQETIVGSLTVGGSPVGTIEFDGVIFGAGFSFTDPEDTTDVLHPSNEGFGVGNNNVADNEGFVATLGGTTAQSFSFDVNFNGGVASTDITWKVFKNGVEVGSGTGTALNPGAPGMTANFTIDPTGDVDFDTVQVRFDFPESNDAAKILNFTAEVGQTTSPTLAEFLFELCATDFDTDEVCAEFLVTVTDTVPTLTLPGVEDPGTEVFEAGLAARALEPAGSGEIADGDSNNDSDPSEATAGSFTFTSQDDLQTLTIAGTELTLAQLQAAMPGTPIDIAGNFGTMSITGFAGTEAGGVVSYTYTLADNTSGNSTSDDFAIEVKDSDNDTITGILQVAIVDDNPDAVLDTDATGTGLTATGNVITDAAAGDSGDSDDGADTPGADDATVTAIQSNNPGGDPLTSVGSGGVIINGEFGTLEIDQDGSYTYTRYNGDPVTANDVFTYTLEDGDGDTDTATLTITIADNGVTISGLAVEGGEETVNEDDLSDGTSPNAAALTQTGTFNINAPDGVDDLTIGGTLVVTDGVVTLPASPIATTYGELTITGVNLGTGEVSYSYELTDNTFDHGPNADNGENTVSDDIAVVLTDLDGDSANSTLNVTVIDDVATANNDSATQTTENAAFTIDAFANDVFGADGVDTDNTPDNTIVTFTQPSQGVVTYDGGTGLFTYTPNAGAGSSSTADSFTYTIEDGDGDTSTATVSVTLQADSVPTVTVTDGTVDEKGLPTRSGEPAGSGEIADGNGADDDDTSETTTGTFSYTTGGDTLAALEVQDSVGTWIDVTAGGTVNGNNGVLTVTVLAGNYSWSYTLADNLLTHDDTDPTGDGDTDRGADDQKPGEAFLVRVTDSDTDVSTTTTLDITVNDDGPTANNDSATQTTENAAFVIDAFANDVFGADGVDTDNTPDNTIVTFTQPSQGVVTYDGGTGLFTYTPNAGAGSSSTADSFTYTIEDGDGDTSTATVSVTLQADSVPTVTVTDGTVDEKGLPERDGGEPEGSGEALADGADGDTSETTTGTFSYTTGDDTLAALEVQAFDGTWVNVTAATDASPITVEGFNGILTVTSDGAGNYSWSYTLSDNLLTHDDTDPTGDGDTDRGADDQKPGEAFAVRVTDSDTDVSTTTTLDITVNDDGPTADDDIVGGTITGSTLLSGLLNNDLFGADGVDTDNSPVPGQVAVTTNAAHGTVIYNDDGTFTYTPDDNYSGSDSFVYTITDGDGDQDTATVSLTVDTDDTPTAGETSITVDDEGLTGGILGNGQSSGDFDVDPNPEHTASGNLPFNVFGDGPADIDLQPMDGQSVVVGTETLTFTWDDANDILTGSSVARGDVLQVTIDDPTTGAYTLTLLQSILHATGNGENDATFDLTYRVQDNDLDAITGTLHVTVDDDTGTISAIQDATLENDNGEIFNGTWNPAFGADGVGSIAIALGSDPAGVDYQSTSLGTTAAGDTVFQVDAVVGVDTIYTFYYVSTYDSGNEAGVLTAYTQAPTGTSPNLVLDSGATYFVLTMDADGTYTFELISNELTTSTVADATSDAPAGNYSPEMYIVGDQFYDAATLPSGATPDVTIDGFTGATDQNVFVNNNGIAVGSGNFDTGERMEFDFATAQTVVELTIGKFQAGSSASFSVVVDGGTPVPIYVTSDDPVLTINAADFGLTDFTSFSITKIADIDTGDAFPDDPDVAINSIVYNSRIEVGEADYNFQVSITDGDGDTIVSADELNVHLTAPVNDAPAGTDNTISLVEDVTYVFTAADFGFSDGDGNNFAGVVIDTLPAGTAGVLRLGNTALAAGTFVTAEQIADGSLIYTPVDNVLGNPQGPGDTSFTFSVRDDGPTGGSNVNEDQTPNTMTLDMSSTNFTDSTTGTESGTILVQLSDPNQSILDPGGSADSITMNTAAGGTTTFTDLNFFQTANNLEMTFNSASGGATITILDHYVAANRIESLVLDDAGSYSGYTLGTSYNLNEDLSGTSGNDIVAGTAAGETITGGNGNDLLFGNGGDDILEGGDGADLLVGGLGDDTLRGGAGRDVLIGGDGNDTYDFDATSESGNTIALADVITDFDTASDMIDLSGIDARTQSGAGNGGNQDFSEAGSGGFTQSASLVANGVTWTQVGSDTHVSIDTNGNTASAEMMIVLTGVNANNLTASNFTG